MSRWRQSKMYIRKLHDVLPADWAVADSDFAINAFALVSASCPEYMVRHCFSSFCFGAMPAARNGLKLAPDFCCESRQSAFSAAAIHNAIASHTPKGIVDGDQLVIKLLHYGTGMDLFGRRLSEIPSEGLKSVLLDHPREGLKDILSLCLQHQADIKPQSQIAGAVRGRYH